MFGAVGELVGYTTYVFSTGDGARSVVLEIPTTTFTEEQFATDTNNAAFNLVEHVFCPTATPSTTATRATQRHFAPALHDSSRP
jgi:hypothetical protein